MNLWKRTEPGQIVLGQRSRGFASKLTGRVFIDKTGQVVDPGKGKLSGSGGARSRTGSQSVAPHGSAGLREGLNHFHQAVGDQQLFAGIKAVQVADMGGNMRNFSIQAWSS